MGTVEELAAEVAGLRRRVERSESILAIEALKARYAELVDQRFSAGAVIDGAALTVLSDAVAALFTADGVWDGGPGLGRVSGRAAIAARLAAPT
ncbi:MAG: nuclear transport factor 2 family protein, partial [Acidimicrobiales bacterium]